MNHLIFFGFVVLSGFFIAKTEINCEGPDGYAKRLPVTWRAKNKWVKRLFTGTSYHLYMGLSLFVIVHLKFAIDCLWTIRGEMLILSFLALFTVVEDFVWFVLNPALNEETGERLYGIRNFNKEHIPWFEWFRGLPLWYWWYLPVGGALYIWANYL